MNMATYQAVWSNFTGFTVLLSSRPKCCYHRYILIYLPTVEVITLNGSLRSSFLASCKDPGVPLNGSRTGDNFEQGETVSFSCNRGYTLIGRKVIRCHKRVWSSSLPQCKSKWLSFRVDVSTYEFQFENFNHWGNDLYNKRHVFTETQSRKMRWK